MSDRMRWRYGDTNPVIAAVDADAQIAIGDLLYQEVNDARPAAAHNDLGSEEANQLVFAEKFLGVAMQRSRDGETAPVRVATTGVFEFDCPAGAFELGDLVGIDENLSGNGLLSQQVAKVADSRYAIGRVARREPLPTTSVLIDVRSTIMTGGVHGGSSSGA